MDYKERVKQELAELSEKVDKLSDFNVRIVTDKLDVSVIQKRLLRKQLKAMVKYKNILQERIDNFDM